MAPRSPENTSKYTNNKYTKTVWVHHIQTVGNQSQTEISNTTKRKKSVKEIVLKEQTKNFFLAMQQGQQEPYSTSFYNYRGNNIMGEPQNPTPWCEIILLERGRNRVFFR